MSDDRTPGFNTLAIHAGAQPDAATGARVTPIYQTTSYVFDDVDHAAALFNLETFGNIYTRIMNPTQAVLEERIAALEGGTAALAVASGHAAQMLVFHTLMEPGDEFVAARQLYGGSVNQFTYAFKKCDWTVRWADTDDAESFRAAITPKTKAIFIESIANPGGIITDIAAIAEIAKDAGVPLIVDNTLATPYLTRPAEYGADIIVHSLTKFLGGHGNSIGGAFATGAFATLLATPCSAPFLGTAMGFALSRGPGEILAVFAMLGLGLAVPYLAVAAWPAMATGLPRPGAWMVVLRRVLGGVLLLTAGWLASVLWVVAGAAAMAAVGALLTGLFAALILRRAAPGFKAAATGLAAVCLAALLAVPALTGAPAPGAAARAIEDAGITWQPFDKVKILNHVAEGRVVFVDVTADWCITCAANKALVIDRGAVAARLRGAGVVAMRADWTRPDPKISAYLRSFGRFGIPFNAVYGPAAPAGIVLGELLTTGEVLAALEAARAPRLARGQ